MIENQTIECLTRDWIDLLRDKGEEDALQFYFENISPILLPLLRGKFIDDYGELPKYDGLISLLGFAPDTVILAYQFVKPETLVVLHTEETKSFLDTVVKYAAVPMASFHHEPFVEKPNTDIYRALEAALKRFPKNARVAIELTGGKKTMSGALAIAAGVLDIDLLYIDYTNYMPQFRKPYPESTYIHLVGNPLKLPVDLFSEIEIKRAVTFFNVGKYEVSRTLFEQAAIRMAHPRVAEICADLSKFYTLWNSFAFQEARDLAIPLFDRILSFYHQVSSVFQFDIESFKKQMETIKKLGSSDRMFLLWNFYFSAERYEQNGQNDIAALLYYRTLESIFDNCLKDKSEMFTSETPDYSLFEMEEESLAANFVSFREKVLKKPINEPMGLPSPLAMFDALCLLGALSHPIAAKVIPGRVANTARIRNRSIYAHGLNPIDQKSVSEIRNLADDTLMAYIEIKQTGKVDQMRPGFKFIELNLRSKD